MTKWMWKMKEGQMEKAKQGDGGRRREVRMRWCNWCVDIFRKVFHMLSVPAGRTALKNEMCERQVVWPWHRNGHVCVGSCLNTYQHTLTIPTNANIFSLGGWKKCLCVSLRLDDCTSHHRGCHSYWSKQLKKHHRHSDFLTPEPFGFIISQYVLYNFLFPPIYY